MTHDDIDPTKAIEYIFTHGQKYAEAKAEVTFLEQFRKSKHAMLMKSAMVNGHSSAASQEREAYADMEYIELLKGLKAATEKAEAIKWGLVAAQARIEVYRTQSANDRALDKAML